MVLDMSAGETQMRYFVRHYLNYGGTLPCRNLAEAKKMARRCAKATDWAHCVVEFDPATGRETDVYRFPTPKIVAYVAGHAA
jgi:hypothetical protein